MTSPDIKEVTTKLKIFEICKLGLRDMTISGEWTLKNKPTFDVDTPNF